MKESYSLYLALIHHPVVNKNGETIASAVTNLDLHDIARAAKTYGVRAFYVVTPLEDQLKLVQSIVSHWQTGSGAVYNPARKAALDIIRVKASYAEVLEDICTHEGQKPQTVVTSAKQGCDVLTCKKFREMVWDGQPYLINFGTAWGLSPEFIADADYMLEPVKGNGDYNHLSVRSAASIILDRILSKC